MDGRYFASIDFVQPTREARQTATSSSMASDRPPGLLITPARALLDAPVPVGPRIDLLLTSVSSREQALPICPVKHLANDLAARSLVRLKRAFPVVAVELRGGAAGFPPVELPTATQAHRQDDRNRNDAGSPRIVHVLLPIAWRRPVGPVVILGARPLHCQ